MTTPWAPRRRALYEIAFIIFLFYSNLLMGEFTRSAGHGKSWATGFVDIFTLRNFAIALLASVAGHFAFEGRLKKF